MNISLQTAYSREPYHFSPHTVGLLFIPSSLGYVTGSLTGGRWSDSVMLRAAIKRWAATGGGKSTPLEHRPEDRMGVNAWIAGTMFPSALICYGWIVQQGYHWAAPLPFTYIFGFGSMLVFGMAIAMLTGMSLSCIWCCEAQTDGTVEFVPGRASSTVAVNNREPPPLSGHMQPGGSLTFRCSCQKHVRLYWEYLHRARHKCDWEWLAIHNPRYTGVSVS